MKLIFLSVLFINCFISVYCDLKCRDENNQPVDWFYLYKLPEELNSNDIDSSFTNKNNGLKYLYLTSEQKNIENWISSEKTINDVDSIPGNTISQLYKSNSNDIVSLMYNDEPPNGKTDFTNGHTKGVVGANNQTGFWLIHSVPHFPSSFEDKHYSYPATGHKYGQSFLCITMDTVNIDLVGKQLIYNEPTVYSHIFPTDFQKIFPNLFKVINGEKNKISPFYNLELLKSIDGIEFKSFAKGRAFEDELYNWVAQSVSSNLFVESWLNGPGKINSDCSKLFKVFNVADIKLEISNETVTFSTHRDHSKWAVSNQLSANSKPDYICVGDINREEHQKYRGGGTVCQQNNVISGIYQKTILDFEKCSRII